MNVDVLLLERRKSILARCSFVAKHTALEAKMKENGCSKQPVLGVWGKTINADAIDWNNEEVLVFVFCEIVQNRRTVKFDISEIK